MKTRALLSTTAPPGNIGMNKLTTVISLAALLLNCSRAVIAGNDIARENQGPRMETPVKVSPADGLRKQTEK